MAQSDLIVEVQIADAFRGRVDPELFRRSAVAALRHQGATGPAELTVVLSDDQVMRELNRAYRGVDATTDVLAFGTEEADGFAFATPPEVSRYLGDVIVSFPQAEAQAQVAGHPVETETELQLLTVHGVLHLLGHDHALPDEKAVMWAAQSKILEQL